MYLLLVPINVLLCVFYIHAKGKAHIHVFVSFAGENTFDTCSSCRSHYTDAPLLPLYCTSTAIYTRTLNTLMQICVVCIILVLPTFVQSLTKISGRYFVYFKDLITEIVRKWYFC